MKNIIGIVSFLALSMLGGTLYYIKRDNKPLYSLDALKDLKNIVPVAIIGGGPAGITAGMYTARARFSTIVFGGSKLGGELMEAGVIENWPAQHKMSGQELMKIAEDQATSFGATIVPLAVKHIDFKVWPFQVTLDNDDHVHALSVIVTTGGAQKLPKIPGIDKYYGKGIGICTICDAPFDKDADVAVVGCTDAACDKALQLAAYAKKVTMIIADDAMKATSIVQEYIQKTSNIELLYSTSVLSVEGNEQHATGVKLLNKSTHKESLLPIKTVYFALGFSPSSELFKNQLTTDKEGYIILKPRTHVTSVYGVFAAGNVTDPFYQKSGYASGMGIGAALDAIEFLTSIGVSASVQQSLLPSFYVPNCTMALHPIATSHELTALFDKKLPVVVVFHMHHCPLCQETIRHINTFAQRLEGRVNFAMVDIQQAAELVKTYKVERVPAVFIFKDGKLLEHYERSSLENLKKSLEKLSN